MAKKVTPKTTETPKDDKSNENEMTALANDTTKMIVGERGLAFAVYVLYLLGYFMGITALIGVVIA
jgi:uncharacterized membrane protein